MSLNIYTGFKIDKVFSAYELLEFSKETIRPVIVNAYKNMIKEICINRIINILDVYNNYNILDDEIKKDINLLVMSQSVFYKKEVFDLFNLPCLIYIYPLKDKTLFYLTSDNDIYLSNFSKIKNIEKYDYWESVEEPDEISDDEWNIRYNDWDEALGSIYYLKDSALILDIIRNFEFVVPKDFYKDINNFIPTKKQRLKFLEDYQKTNKLEKKDFKFIGINKETFGKSINEILDENSN